MVILFVAHESHAWCTDISLDTALLSLYCIHALVNAQNKIQYLMHVWCFNCLLALDTDKHRRFEVLQVADKTRSSMSCLVLIICVYSKLHILTAPSWCSKCLETVTYFKIPGVHILHCRVLRERSQLLRQPAPQQYYPSIQGAAGAGSKLQPSQLPAPQQYYPSHHSRQAFCKS